MTVVLVKCQLTEEQLGVDHRHVWMAWIHGVEAHRSRFPLHHLVQETCTVAIMTRMIQAARMTFTISLPVTGVMSQAALDIQIEAQHIHRRHSMNAMSAQ